MNRLHAAVILGAETCWRPVMPNRRYTRISTATGLMRKHAAALTAPASKLASELSANIQCEEETMTRFVTQLADDALAPAIEIEGAGYVTLWRGVGWTHALQRFGTEAFATKEEAELAFWQTEANLPESVHLALFGTS